MKKLTLNKQTIAQLTNPQSIYGGAEISNGGTCMDNPEHEYYTGGKSTLTILTQKWHCPSEQYTFCYVNQCPKPECR